VNGDHERRQHHRAAVRQVHRLPRQAL